MKLSLSKIWLRKMNPADWSLAFKVLIQPCSMVHPAAQSESPDKIFSGMHPEPVLILSQSSYRLSFENSMLSLLNSSPPVRCSRIEYKAFVTLSLLNSF